MRIRSRATIVITLILTLSMTNLSVLIGHQKGIGMAQAQTSSLYPVTVTLSTDETLFIATHTSNLVGGNWIELSDGTPINLPSPLILAYEGLDSASYDRDGVTVTIESSFASGEATYPLTTHQVYNADQTITATFWGADPIMGPVDFKLITISSIAEARNIFTEIFQGNLDTIKAKFNSPVWSQSGVAVNVNDGATVNIAKQEPGVYLLAVVKQDGLDIYINSATIIEVVDQTLYVTAPLSVEQGDPLTVNTGLTGTYVHGAILIKQTAYSGEIKLITKGSVLSTEIHLNNMLMADGADAIDTESLSVEDVILLLGQVQTAFGSNQMAFGTSLVFGSISLSTVSLATGEYVLLVGVYNILTSRIVGVYQDTVTVTPPYEPPPPPPNQNPVANAGADRTAIIDIPASFDGSGSTDSDGTIINYAWTFGDGGTGTGVSPSHTYTTAGTYTVSLTVTDDDGAPGSDSLTVTVKEEITPEVIEDLPPDEAADIIEEMNTTKAADIIEAMNATAAADVIEEVSTEVAADIVEEMTVTSAADVIEEMTVTVAADVIETVSAESAADIIEEMIDDAAVYVLVEVETSAAATIMEAVEEEEAGDLIDAAVQTGSTDQFSDIMLEMEENATAGALLASEPASGAEFVETMATKNLTKTAEIVEAAVKLRARELEPEAQEALLNKAAIMLEDVSVESLLALFMEIITLPATPSTVATVFEVMDLGKVLEVVEAWIDLEAYEGLATVFDLLTQETLVNIYLGMTSADRTALYPYLSEETKALLPSLAIFQVSELTVTPSQVKPGENVTISATVTNVGEESGEYTAILTVNGVTEETETVTLAADESTTISFTVSRTITGVYTVEIDGQTGSFTVEPTIPEPPVADAGGPYTVRVDVSLTFDGTDSDDPDGTIIGYAWDFGDGESGAGSQPNHIYHSTGTYDVNLTVTDNDGLTHSDQTTVTVTSRPTFPPGIPNTQPVADAGPDQTAYIDQIVEFSGANSTDPDGQIISHIWNFGDGEEASGVNVSHTYLEPGNYTVSLTVRDNRNGEDSDTCTITVIEHIIPTPPLPPFLSDLTITPEELELGDEVTISLDIMNPNDGAISYGFEMQIGELTLLIDVELEAYESKTVSRTIFPTAVGTYNVTVMGMTGSFTVSPVPTPPTPPTPAEFTVSNLIISPEDVDEGEAVTISVDVTNVGEEMGSYTVDLVLNGVVVESEEIPTLWGGMTVTVVFELTRGMGSYTVDVDGLTGSFVVSQLLIPLSPAEFVVSNLFASPDEVEEGEDITISITVTNIGETEGTYTVEFNIDGVTIETETVTLAGGETTTIYYEETWTAGTYQINVEDLTETFTVSEIPPIPFWMQPGTIAGILLIIIAIAAILYANWKGILPTLTPQIEEKIE